MDILKQKFHLEDVTFDANEWSAFTYHPSESVAVLQSGDDDYNCGVFVILWIRALLIRPIFDGQLDFGSIHGDSARRGLLHLVQCFSAGRVSHNRQHS